MLARQLYKHIPEEFQLIIDENRLLIISVSNTPRQSKATALARNKYICEIADRILFVEVNKNSSLYPLKEKYQNIWRVVAQLLMYRQQMEQKLYLQNA